MPLLRGGAVLLRGENEPRSQSIGHHLVPNLVLVEIVGKPLVVDLGGSMVLAQPRGLTPVQLGRDTHVRVHFVDVHGDDGVHLGQLNLLATLNLQELRRVVVAVGLGLLLNLQVTLVGSILVVVGLLDAGPALGDGVLIVAQCSEHAFLFARMLLTTLKANLVQIIQNIIILKCLITQNIINFKC